MKTELERIKGMKSLKDYTAEIVTAHVSNNNVAVSDLSGLIEIVYLKLASLSGEGEQDEENASLTPATSKSASVRDDYVVCMACGERFLSLTKHLSTAHDMTPDDYRRAFNLKKEHPLVAPASTRARSAAAIKRGMGKKPRLGRQIKEGH